ncbi:SCO family protein [Edaphobacter acidisoli]|uniref:SCO family protein n=1 Tax=Edaphobacter acidisoli TaxID=2040573 RepID=UPI00402B69A1
MLRKSSVLLVLALGLIAGCHRSSNSAASSASAAQKTFTIRGKVVSTDQGSVMLDGDAVPGFMDAMTMPYKLKDPSVASELHPGDHITATVLADQEEDGFHDVRLDNIVVTAQARPDYKPAVQYHVPTPGDVVPNFKLLNQSGRTIDFAEFKGKVLLVTFIYTRCPLPDFCVRMSRDFATVDKDLSADPVIYAKTHLLSISFDPKYDTPKVLRSYGGAYTGRYTKETFEHWDFAAPSEEELPKITQYFDVGVTPGDARTLTHSLSTVLIGKDGKVLAWYPTNDWKPEDVAAAMKKAANS